MSALPFIDLQAQRRRLGDRIDAAIARVLAHGRFILGPEVAELENVLAERAGCAHAVACANGTDALLLPLLALGVGPGDAVYVPAFTFAATGEVVVLCGATPIFVDVEAATFNLDTESLSAAIAETPRDLTPRAIIPVDLFGQAADHAAIAGVAARHDLIVIDDAAQSFGATRDGRACGSFGDVGATSFFPAKPLGCYGDGGAMLTDDGDLAAQLRSLRHHGAGTHRYDQVAVGMNSRLDTMQAAILLEKLAIFDEEIVARDRIAARYSAALGDLVTVPRLAPGCTSVWAQYTICTPRRDDVAAALETQGIPTAVYYPRALNDQPAFVPALTAPGGVPVSQALANEVLSLPMHPYLDAVTQDRIVAAVRTALKETGASAA